MWCLCTFLYVFVCLSVFTSQQLEMVCTLKPGHGTHHHCEDTHTEGEGKREVLALVYFAVMRHREHKAERELTYVDDTYMILLLFYTQQWCTSGYLPQQTLRYISQGNMMWTTACMKVNISVRPVYLHKRQSVICECT